MLSCREVASRASDYVDRNLSRRERLVMQLHLMMCVRCRRFVRHVRLLVAALASRGDKAQPSVDDALVDRIVSRLPADGSDPDRV